MATTTQNFNLKKPAQEDFYNIDDHNTNMDKIDQALKDLEENSSFTTEEIGSIKSLINAIVSGATSVGNATKLSGKAHTDFAPNGFGLGATFGNKVVTDANDAKQCGWHSMAMGGQNAPYDDHWMILPVTTSNSLVTQLTATLNNSKNRLYVRSSWQNEWNNWSPICKAWVQLAEPLNPTTDDLWVW